jgi:uncharacterized protein (TIGR00369 family)
MIDPAQINAMLAQAWPAATVQCLEVSATHAVASYRPRPESLRPGGYISGPTQFAAADSALWFLASGVLGRAEPMALTSELSIRFLRPGVGEVLYARADLDRAGKTSVVATVRVWTDDRPDRPCATAQGTYVLPRDG